MKPHGSVMSDSSKQLTLFDCASLKSAAKRAKVIPGDLSAEASGSNEVCEEYYGNPSMVMKKVYRCQVHLAHAACLL